MNNSNEQNAKSIVKLISNANKERSKKNEMSYERLYPVTKVERNGNSTEILYTPDEWREMLKICDDTFNDAKREFMEWTNVYVSDGYFADNFIDDWFSIDYIKKDKFCKDWFTDKFERNMLEKLIDSKYYVVSEDAVDMGLMPEQALSDDTLRGKISVLDIIQLINKHRDELDRKCFTLSEHIADIYNSDQSQLKKSIAEAIKHADEDGLINCGIDIKEIKQ